MDSLMEAIKAGDTESVRAQIDTDPALLVRQENGVTPLLFAVYHGQSEIARLLVERGAPVTFPEACALGDLAFVVAALEADPGLKDSRSTDGFPALGLAIFFRQPEVARRLIELGSDVNAAAVNPLRVAPVHAAAAVCDHETMRLLIRGGADVNARQQMDYTALHGVASRGDRGLAELLLSHGADATARGSDGATAADVARKYGHAAFADWIETLI